MRLFALLLLLISAIAAPARAQAGLQRTDEIAVELVSMSQWATPGSTAVIALRQEIAPGWHTYWRNPGDSGEPTAISWRLPQGVTAGEIVWPVPERQKLYAFVNYGFSGEIYLPSPIQVPATARGTLPIRAKVDLFVCSDTVCTAQPFELALDLPVREGAAPLTARHGQAIQATLQGAPQRAAITGRATVENGRFTLTATGGPLVSPELSNAWFYPYDDQVLNHSAPQAGRRGPRGLTLTAPAADPVTAGPITGLLATNLGAFEITAERGPPLPGAEGAGALKPFAGDRADPRSTPEVPLWQAALLALAGGLILNLMPCVFPILAMKAAALAGAAHEPGRARADGLAFLIGVLSAFLALAGVLLALRAGGEAIGWGFQLQSPAVTAALALLMLAVALNLSGVFHIGAGVQGLGSGPLARLPGAAGAFMTGVLAVVVAAPCTAPFMAVALGAALVMPAPAALLVFFCLGLGLALPYVAFSLAPAVLRRLPRPGAWMERLKALLAFPMYGAALWLAWVFSAQAGSDALALLFGAGLLLALALWLAGQGQARRLAGGRGVLHLTTALAVLILGGAALVVGVRAAVPQEASARQTALPSQPWSEPAVQAALQEGRPVLVNFTADWCVTCKLNEGAALSTPRTAEALRQANAVYLVGDWTRRDDAITRALQSHGRSGVPLYLVYTPGEARPRILPQILTEGAVAEALEPAARPAASAER